MRKSIFYPIICVMMLQLSCFTASYAQTSLKIDYTQHIRPTSETVYKVIGQNLTNKPQLLVIRLKDKKEAPYHDRVNEERWVLPGPFEILFQPSALQTPGGRFLTLSKLHDIKVFSPHELTFTHIETVPLQYKKAPYAFDFGAQNSPIFPGFTLVSPSSPFLKDTKAHPFIRKGADSLIRDGLKGVTKFEIPIPNGTWRVSLWTEDLGDWETLPPLYERRIRVNGQNISLIRQNHDAWVKNTYLAGQHPNASSPWHAFGQRRGRLIQAEVDINNENFKLEFAGSNIQSTTISALLIEKKRPQSYTLFHRVEAARQKWFHQRWPYITDIPKSDKIPEKIVAFAGETFFIPADARPLTTHPFIKTKTYYGQRAFHRYSPNSGLLIQTLKRFSPRYKSKTTDLSYHQISIPSDMAAGVYNLGSLTVHIIADKKPKIKQSVGIYLETAPHLKKEANIDLQTWCDLDYLNRLGLTAVAPPFSHQLEKDYQRARAFNFNNILAYTPMKENHAAVKKALRQNQINDLIFSIADEPSNPAQSQDIPALSQFLQNESKFAKRAGHLNNPKDIKYLSFFDLVLINAGFGVDYRQIQSIKKQQKEVWFYNMENPEVAAGFYLWRTKANGYLQWHGRMPTADPYDPTDGREDDVQMLYPAETVCSNDFDIDHSLIQIVNGLSNLRWLTWLDQKAEYSKEAKKLKYQILKKIPMKWEDAQSISSKEWLNIKKRIQELALGLQF